MILLLHEWPGGVFKPQFRGFCRFAKLRNWKIVRLRVHRNADLEAVCRRLAKGDIAGIISSTRVPLPKKISDHWSVVYFDYRPRCAPDGSVWIGHDAERTAHLAMNELKNLGYPHYAYAADSLDLYWNRERGAAFAREAQASQHRLCPGIAYPDGCRSSRDARALADWVGRLPRPCAVFAANDGIARQIVDACEARGLNVPRELAVVGVDNDEQLCCRDGRSITSIAPDWEGGAFLAASMLDRILRGKGTRGGEMRFCPLGIFRRKSSAGVQHRSDLRVIRAVELIRAEACSGLRAAEVVRQMRCPRRTAELYFREITGMSILEEIRRVRFENARILLERSDESIARVAALSGYLSQQTFAREFKRVAGMSPLVWRQRSQGAG